MIQHYISELNRYNSNLWMYIQWLFSQIGKDIYIYIYKTVNFCIICMVKHLATPQMSTSYRYMNMHIIKNIHIEEWKWKLLSCIQLFATPWTIEFMEFSRPEYGSGYPFPSPGDLLKPGIEPRSSTLQADSLPPEPQVKPKNTAVGSLSFLQWIFPIQESNQQVDSLPTWAVREACKRMKLDPCLIIKKKNNSKV